MRCCCASRGARSSSTTSAARSTAPAATPARPAGRRRDQGRRRRGGRRHQLGRHARGRRGDRADRARRVRPGRHRRQQRRASCATRAFHNMTPDLVDPSSTSTSRARSTSPSRPGCTCASRATAGSWSPRRRAGLLGNFGQANYGAAKMGLVGLTHVLAVGGRAQVQHQGQRDRARLARTRMTEEILGDDSPTSSSPSWCRRSWRGWPTRTARSPATSTRSAAGASPGCSSARPGATSTDRSPSKTCATTSTRSTHGRFHVLRNATDELRVVAKLLG